MQFSVLLQFFSILNEEGQFCTFSGLFFLNFVSPYLKTLNRRTILFLIFGGFVFFLAVFYVEVMRKLSNWNIVHFMDCVGSHPQDSPPPCERQYNNGYSFIILFLILVLLPECATVILFWTNPNVFLWWKELIFSRRVLTLAKKNYQEIGINRDTSSNL